MMKGTDKILMENAGVETTLELHDVTTGYRSRGHIVEVGRHYTATLPSGQLTCLLGVNGSGKSTLLRSLSKSQKILSGSITAGGRDLTEIPDSEVGKLIGIVLTDKAGSANMRVSELVALGRAPYSNFWGTVTSADRRIAEEAMECIGITALRDRYVGSLSDGERQKVMIAKTLAQQTPVILLDEPAAFLDYPSRLELMMLMRRLAHDNGKTILLSTHDIPLAMQLSDHLWLVDSERHLVTGTPDALGASGKIGATFDRDGVIYDHTTRTFRI